ARTDRTVPARGRRRDSEAASARMRHLSSKEFWMQQSYTHRGGAGVAAQHSAMMFLQFFVWGGWYVTGGEYMGAHGMDKVIAWAYSVGPIAAIISPFFLGMVADRFFATERVLGAMHLLGAIALLAAPYVAQTGSHEAFIGVLLLHTLCYMPTLG